jgi:hypothetical protein
MRRILCAVFAALAVWPAGPAAAALLSKKYQFRPGVKLDVGTEIEGGLRLDTIQFVLPASAGSEPHERTAGKPYAVVAVSNAAQQSRRVAIAIALFDDQGRLLGVASGGTRLLGIKPGRQTTYTLVFDDVNSEVHRASTFQLSVEPQ